MKTFRFYIGTKAGECARNTRYEGVIFSKAQVAEAIERIRIEYNAALHPFPKIDGYPFQKIDGYSLYSIEGCWQGGQEASHVLEVMTEDMDEEVFASGLKAALHQDSIMVTVQGLEVKFL